MNIKTKINGWLFIVAVILSFCLLLLSSCNSMKVEDYKSLEATYYLDGIRVNGSVIYGTSDDDKDFNELVKSVSDTYGTIYDSFTFSYEGEKATLSGVIVGTETSDSVVLDCAYTNARKETVKLEVAEQNEDSSLYNYISSTAKIETSKFTGLGKQNINISFGKNGGFEGVTLEYSFYTNEMDSEKNKYHYHLPDRADKYPDTEGNEQEQPEEQFAGYTLNRFYVKVQGLPDVELDPNNLSSTDQTLYEAVLTMYGKTLEMSDKGIKFASTSIFATYNTAAYTKSGNDITFTNADLAEVASGATDGDKFNLKVAGYVFEYVKN